MGLQVISTAKVRKGKLGGVEVSTGMRAESPGLLKNTRNVEFSAGSQGSRQGDEERRGRAVIFSNRVKPCHREGPQCGLGGGKREDKQAVPWRDRQKCRMYSAEDSQKITRPDREIRQSSVRLTVRSKTSAHKKVSESKGHGNEIGFRFRSVAIIGRTIEGEVKISLDRSWFDRVSR